MSCGWAKHSIFPDDLVANLDAFVTDVDHRPGDELLHITLGLAAERTSQNGRGLRTTAGLLTTAPAKDHDFKRLTSQGSAATAERDGSSLVGMVSPKRAPAVTGPGMRSCRLRRRVVR